VQVLDLKYRRCTQYVYPGSLTVCNDVDNSNSYGAFQVSN